MDPFRQVDTLLFDMDGTITDLAKRWWDPFFRALRQLKPDLDEKKMVLEFEKQVTDIIQAATGNSKYVNIRVFWKVTGVMKLSILERIKLLRILWNDPLAFKEIHPVEGAEKTIEILKQRCYTLALVTSASNRTAAIAQQQLEFFDNFSLVVTRDMVNQVKPHPEGILFACKKLSKKPNQCVMIGDFPQDIRAGKKAGAKTIAVLGLNSRFTGELLREQKPDLIIDSVLDLLGIFPDKSKN